MRAGDAHTGRGAASSLPAKRDHLAAFVLAVFAVLVYSTVSAAFQYVLRPDAATAVAAECSIRALQLDALLRYELAGCVCVLLGVYLLAAFRAARWPARLLAGVGFATPFAVTAYAIASNAPMAACLAATT